MRFPGFLVLYFDKPATSFTSGPVKKRDLLSKKINVSPLISDNLKTCLLKTDAGFGKTRSNKNNTGRVNANERDT